MNGYQISRLSLFVLFSILIGNTQAKETKQFDEVDALINKLEKSANVMPDKVELKSGIIAKKEEVKHPISDVSNSLVKNENQNKQENKKITTTKENDKMDLPTPAVSNNIKTIKDNNDEIVLATKIVELPPNTRFEFNKTMFLPAYKTSFVFFNGRFKGALDTDASVADFFLEKSKDYQEICMLTSDKSYVLFRGKNKSDKKATFLDVNKVKLLKATKNDKEITIVNIDFLPKETKNNSVNLSLYCLNAKPESVNFDLKDLNIATNGLFKYNLPKFIEL